MTENSRMFRNKKERNEESWNQVVYQCQWLKDTRKTMKENFENDKFLKRILERK